MKIAKTTQENKKTKVATQIGKESKRMKQNTNDAIVTKVSNNHNDMEAKDCTEQESMKSEDQQPQITFTLKNDDEKCTIKEINGKMECPFCKLLVKNISNIKARKYI